MELYVIRHGLLNALDVIAFNVIRALFRMLQ